jgi:hypothetical protein
VPIVALLQLGFVYLPTMNFFFGSSPLGSSIWLRIILVSAPVVLVVGLEKAVRGRLSNP